MSIIDRIFSVLAPYECIGCTAEGRLLCAGCALRLNTIPERCYRCRKLSAGAMTCSACFAAAGLYRVRAAASYEGMAKELVASLKYGGAQTAAKEIAGVLAPLMQAAAGTLCMPVPTASSRIRGRGYDQARLIARAVSVRTGTAYLDGLIRLGQTHQVGSSRQQRLLQMHDVFRVRSPQKVRGRRILLMDDVMTTGATLEAAARALRLAGAARIEAAVFCAA